MAGLLLGGGGPLNFPPIERDIAFGYVRALA